ncbi:SDR family NAD(P)-dependent oxidoreductase [Microbulbifer bruguierae]|uniref:SDR family NAD(P)-dependent oxidoreductase n=1 Tax=Microbulbifer bruguierae TaxID=3029061 RepID=A0ABY8NHE6_9GAMM|nr:SDR family NAD(P)-dependent oxidoreductase [Microbulbifer bruguierae]WGL17784.1 SDR family NAD(P)-dependent oxidoreductase [Microbulbifer bruguierae]
MTERMTEILGLGKVAVITGAAKGIGSALAQSLARRGMRLALFDRDERALRAMVQTLETELVCVTGDVANYADLTR